jgi:type II secretory pathway pseudopilin PulG
MTAVIAILAGIRLPALGKTKAKAQGIQCMSRLRQLGLAWHLYAGDHNDAVVLNAEGVPPERAWVGGYLDNQPNNPENTNMPLITRGLLYPYVGAAGVYKEESMGLHIRQFNRRADFRSRSEGVPKERLPREGGCDGRVKGGRRRGSI